MGKTCSTHREIGKCIRNCNLKTSKGDTNGRPSYRSDNKIKMDLKAIGSKRVDWIQLSQAGG